MSKIILRSGEVKEGDNISVRKLGGKVYYFIYKKGHVVGCYTSEEITEVEDAKNRAD